MVKKFSNKPFSRQRYNERVIEHEVQRAEALSRANENPDWTIKHADWCRDATKPTPDYTVLKTQVTKQYKKIQQDANLREMKKHG